MGQLRLNAALLLVLVALTTAARGDVPPPLGDALGCFGDSAGTPPRCSQA
jgi:hypothetical protein